MTEAEILAEATRIATTALYTSAAEAAIADALRKAATVDVIARMPRCNTCRHWHQLRKHEDVYADERPGACFMGARMSGLPPFTEILWTGPFFGCTLHSDT